MKQYHKNPRQISKKQYEHLAETLSRLGDLGGIVHNLETDEIIGGNQRMTVFKDGAPEIIETLSAPDEQGTVAHGFIVWKGHKFAYRQVRWDEKTAEEANIVANVGGGDWSWDIIANQWDTASLMDWGMDESLLKSWNNDANALKEMLTAEKSDPVDAEPQIDRAAELNEKWQVKTGDLFKIGEHRLLCGDSTVKADVERVMGGEKAEMLLTDPPYGVKYDSAWRAPYSTGEYTVGKIENDDRADWTETYQLIDAPIAYVWHGGLQADIVAGNLKSVGYELRAQIIWNKGVMVFGRGHYHWKHEPCWYAVKKGCQARFVGNRSQNTVWDCANNYGASRTGDELDEFNGGHISQKPVHLMVKALTNHEVNIVADPFCGSGTTMVACENLHRKCRAIEISPNYCAVILERMSTAFPEIEIEKIL